MEAETEGKQTNDNSFLPFGFAQRLVLGATPKEEFPPDNMSEDQLDAKTKGCLRTVICAAMCPFEPFQMGSNLNNLLGPQPRLSCNLIDACRKARNCL